MTSTLEAPTAPDAAVETSFAFTVGSTADRRRVALGVLLVATAVTYLWNITVNGMGNPFYAGAAQAGSKNWEALLFGSVDPDNFITVDKPPVSQWVMGLSGQIFGFSSASMLVPEALMAVASVALLYGAVRRSRDQAGLLAGASFALTPVVALMFRYNNPDAVMVLLMTAAAYCTVRALERASAKWLALAGAALGFAFLAKMLEGLMVAPAIGLAYVIVAPTTVRRRLIHLARRRGRMPGVRGLVRGADAAVAGLVAAVYRRFDRQQLHEPGPRLQRLRRGYSGATTAAVHVRPVGRFALGPTPNIVGHHGGFNPFGGADPGITRLFSGEFGFESAGCSPPPCSPWCWSSSRAGGHHAPTSPAAAPSSSAAGC